MKKSFLLKLLICLILAVISVVCFTACGNAENVNDANNLDNNADNNGDLEANPEVFEDWSYQKSTDGKYVVLQKYNGVEKNVIIPSSYQNLPVVSIASGAFKNNKKLESVIILNGVTKIGSEAFSGCSSLTSVTMPDSVVAIGDQAFYSCSKLTTLVLSDQVTSIGSEAFAGCSKLKLNEKDNLLYLASQTNEHFALIGAKKQNLNSVKVYSTCKVIAKEAFYNFTSIRSVVIPDGIVTIGNNAFYNCQIEDATIPTFAIPYIKNDVLKKVEITSGTTIFENAFSGCAYLAEVKIANSVIAIESEAFYGCSSLGNINIPNSVTTIGEKAFKDCTTLTKLKIGNGLTAIGDDAFINCPIQEASIPAIACYYIKNEFLREVKVTSGAIIAERAFYNCAALTSVTMADSVTTIGNSAFVGCSSLTSIKLPNSIECIGDYLFFACSSLENVEIPNSITKIGGYAFVECDNLQFKEKDGLLYLGNKDNKYLALIKPVDEKITSAVIKSNCKIIADDAFRYCSELTDIQLPASVKKIGSYTFVDCTKLAKVNYTGTIDQWVGIDFETPQGNPLYYTKNLHINDELVTNVVLKKATNVSSYAFYNCESIESVKLANSVNAVGAYAFYNCSSLRSIEISSKVTQIDNYAFSYCNSLESVEYKGTIDQWVEISFENSFANPICHAQELYVKDKLVTDVTLTTATKIMPYAFSNYSLLESVKIPSSITSVSSNAFENCNNLQYKLKDGLLYLGNDDNKYVALIKPSDKNITAAEVVDNCKIIASEAFLGCSSLTSIVISNNLSSIGSRAFAGCEIEKATVPMFAVSCINKESLKEIVITSGKYIADGLFNGVTSLVSVTIDSEITSIGEYAFNGCEALTTVKIPDTLTSLGKNAFYGCDSLREIELPNSLTFIGEKALSSCQIEKAIVPYIAISHLPKGEVKDLEITNGTDIEKEDFEGYSSLVSVKFTTVTMIQKQAFKDFTSLKSVVFSDSTTSIGEKAFENCYSLTNVYIPDSVKNIGKAAFSACISLETVSIGEGVKGISDSAFEGCINLSSVEMSENVVSIGEKAFSKCSSLKEISLPNSIKTISAYAFAACSLLNDVVIPSNLTCIEKYVFENCKSLKSIVVPDNVAKIADFAFDGCKALATVEIAANINEISDSSFNNCAIKKAIIPTKALSYVVSPALEEVTVISGTTIGEACFKGCTALTKVELPQGLTNIEKEAFKSCEKLANIEIPNTVTFVGASAFANCKSLESVELPVGVTNISKYAFEGCSSLKSVTLGNDVTNIENRAFSNCLKLTDVELGNSLTTIGDYAFSCTAITSVEIPNSIITIEENAFWGCEIEKAVIPASMISYFKSDALKEVVITAGEIIEERIFGNSKSLISVELLDGITTIKDYAFSSCEALVSVKIPQSVTAIGSYVFAYCSSLESIEIPDSVESLGRSSFFNCSSLKTAIISDKITIVDKYAFYNCSSLVSLKVSDEIKSIDYFAFYNCSSLTEFVIPDSLTSIGESAFDKCSALTKVNYLGTIDQWTSINFINESANPIYSARKLYLNNKLVTDLDLASVTLIGNYAFYNCESLTSVVLSKNTEDIGCFAFNGCENLQFNIQGDVAYLASQDNPFFALIKPIKDNIEAVAIDSSCKVVASKAFYNISSLESLEIPKSVARIGGNAFYGCPIEKATTPAWALVCVNNNALKEVVITGGTIIDKEVFSDSTALKKITIPKSVKTIGESAFKQCSKLEKVNYLGTIDEWASINFENSSANPISRAKKLYINDKSVTKIELTTVTSVSDYAFYKLDAVTRVVLGESVTSVGKKAFGDCSSLKNVQISSNLSSIASNAFSGCQIEKATIPTKAISSIANSELKEVVIVGGNSIAKEAFKDCKSLTSITLAGSVKEIGESAFKNCKSLTSISLNGNTTSVGKEAFSGCSSLSNISFNGTVEKWETVSKGKDWNKDVSANKVVCTDGDVEFE